MAAPDHAATQPHHPLTADQGARLEGEANVAAWAGVFADIEVHLEKVGPDMEDADVQALVAWKPPADLGPIPEGLVEYGQALLLDLQRATSALQQLMAANRRQSRVADAVPPARERGASGYLDVQA